MEKLISPESRNSLIKLGLYQVIGGSIGILLVFWLLYKTAAFTTPVLIIALIMVLFFAYSVFAGILCLQISDKAIFHSYINQGMQVCGFELLGFGFHYIAGFSLAIGFDFRGSSLFSFDFGIFKFIVHLFVDHDAFSIQFNLVALAILWWMTGLHSRIKKEKEISEDTDFL